MTKFGKNRRFMAGILCVATVLVWGGLALEAHRAMPEELREQLHAYAESTMFPAMDQWKNQIDAVLAGEDLDKLNELRNRASVLRQDMKEQHAAKREARRAGQEPTETDKQARREGREEMRAIMDELKPLAEHYREELAPIAEQAREQAKVWREETRTLMQTWREEHSEEAEGERPKGCSGKHGHVFGRKHMGHDGHGERGMLKLLLWNGSQNKDAFGSDAGGTQPVRGDVHGRANLKSGLDAGLIGNVGTYPNPAQSSSTIAFTLERAGHVKVSVVDANGRTVARLHDAYLHAGNHEFPFRPGDNLSEGVYFYRINGDGFEESGKILLSK